MYVFLNDLDTIKKMVFHVEQNLYDNKDLNDYY